MSSVFGVVDIKLMEPIVNELADQLKVSRRGTWVCQVMSPHQLMCHRLTY